MPSSWPPGTLLEASGDRGRSRVLLSGSWALQEGSQDSFHRSWGPKGSQKGGPEGPKSGPGGDSSRKHDFIKNQGFAIFSLDRVRTLILDPPGFPFGTLLAPKIAESCLEIALGAPKSRSRALWIGPGGLQERPRRPTGGQNKGTVRATYSQEASKMGPGAILDRF